MIRSLFVRFVASSALCALAILASPAPTSAQTPSASDGGQVVSANPFLLMFEWFNVEYARQLTDSSTWGVSVSFLGFDDGDYSNVTGLYRFYPQGRAMNGFFVGGRAGVYHIDYLGGDGNAFGLGFEIGYDWLLGRERKFAVSIGAGATRLFGGDLNGASTGIPTVRLINLGWRF